MAMKPEGVFGVNGVPGCTLPSVGATGSVNLLGLFSRDAGEIHSGGICPQICMHMSMHTL